MIQKKSAAEPQFWQIRDVPATTRGKVVACKGLLGAKTLAEALDKMADMTLASLQKK